VAGATIDHIVSITIFLAAILLFINLFSQTNQTALVYEQHRATATKCSDLIDTMLLNPGTPNSWGQSNATPTGFGVQDPEFTQYQLSPFSLMRLAPFDADTVTYDKTTPETAYKRASAGSGNSLVISNQDALSYSWALKLLGINNTYGFQLELTPVVNVTIVENHASTPLSLSMRASGTGFSLAHATISYCFIRVSLPTVAGEYPSYTETYGTCQADQLGNATVEFSDVAIETECYAFIAYARLGGLVGVGYHSRVTGNDEYVVPIIDNMLVPSVILAHNYDLNSSGPAGSTLKYKATFVVLTEEFQLRNMTLDSPNREGTLTSGVGNPYINFTIPAYTPGILIVTYQDSLDRGGVVVMPWGISALGYKVTFGGDPSTQEWVSTDMRQVIVNHIAYHAQLSVWSYEYIQQVNR
jgi:hypothetical protein